MKCTSWQFDVCEYCKKFPRWFKTHLFSHIFISIFENIYFYSRSTFQLYNTVLSTVVTMLYIQSSGFIQQKICAFSPTSPHFLQPPTPDNHFYTVSMRFQPSVNMLITNISWLLETLVIGKFKFYQFVNNWIKAQFSHKHTKNILRLLAGLI